MSVGILALQGGYAAHGEALTRLSVSWQLIYKPEQLTQVDKLIIPGGESTTLLKLMQFQHMDKAIIDFAQQGKGVFGTCAGMILLAKQVAAPVQSSLNLMDITVQRNGYGRQIDSFSSDSQCCRQHLPVDSIPTVFIRAPKIIAHGSEVMPLVWCDDETVMVQHNNILAASFHPELSDDLTVHRYFICMPS